MRIGTDGVESKTKANREYRGDTKTTIAGYETLARPDYYESPFYWWRSIVKGVQPKRRKGVLLSTLSEKRLADPCCCSRGFGQQLPSV